MNSKIKPIIALLLFISIVFVIACSKQNTTKSLQRGSGEQIIEGYVVSGGDTTPEGLFDAPRKFVFKIKTDDNSIVDVTYTAYPPSPAGDKERKKIRLSFHSGTILVGDYLKAQGYYDKTTNTLTVAEEGNYIETYAKIGKSYVVSGKISKTESYCGGAAPPQQLEDELRKEKPYPIKKLYVREGNINLNSKPLIVEFTSDENGAFSFGLSKGTYCIFEEYKKAPFDLNSLRKNYEVVSQQCVERLWQTCDKILVIDNDDVSDFDIKYDLKCFGERDYNNRPCIVYDGPLPP